MARVYLLILALAAVSKASHAIDLQGFDDTILFQIDWPGAGAVPEEDKDLEWMVVRTNTEEEYRCFLPKIQEKNNASGEVYEGPNPFQLLAPLFLTTGCYYRIEAFWRYELCHGRHVRQFHDERVGNKIVTQEYYLGRWDKDQHKKLHEEFAGKKASDDVPLKNIEGVNTPYLLMNMTNGTLCDVNEKPRYTRVLYVCNIHDDHSFSLKETSSCEYEVVVSSPFLCTHPKYKRQESKENVINCRPLGSSPVKPKMLQASEAESLAQKQQKTLDDRLRSLFAMFSGDKGAGGQSEDAAMMSVEIRDQERPEKGASEASIASALNFVFGKHCVYGGIGWWKYEFCYGRSIVQFHVNQDATKTVILLGKFDEDEHLKWIKKNPVKRPGPVGARKHVSHLYSGGDVCEETGEPRQTEVKLKCAKVTVFPGAVTLLLHEPKTCEYILTVESNLICGILSSADENGLIRIGEDQDGVTVTTEEEEVEIADDDG